MPDGHKFRIIAVGSEQKVRGIKWEHKRPDLIIGDDLENDEIVMNPERRDKFRNWIYKALLPSRSANGVVRIVGTVLHMDSFLENCMPKVYDKLNYTDEGIKIWSKKDNFGWKSVKYRAHPKMGDYSKILWEERWPKEKLHIEYRKYVEAGKPEGYAQEYLNNPIDETRAFFRRSELIEISADEMREIKAREKPLLFYLSCDLAVSELQRADYSAFVVAGVDEEGTIYIIDIVRQRMDAKEIVDTILDLAFRYQVEAVIIEEGMIKKAVGAYLYAEMTVRGQSWYIPSGLRPSTDKPTRARGIQGRIRQGRVKFNKREDWWPTFEDEMISFPRAVYDDQVDALSWLGLFLNRLSDAPTLKEIHEEEFEEEMRLTMDVGGRSKLTGY
jgi:predicted phage terminase large subunit-like protein